MNKANFDELLKQNVINATGIDFFGYSIANKNYPNYYCAGAFSNFVHQMLSEYPFHYQKYAFGKGSELKQNGITPPKMGSVASSSRFCYLALRNGANALGGSGEVEFEYACPIDKIKGGTPPQIDAYIKNENIFVEVKCHEIFDKHNVKLSAQYYDLLFGEDCDFSFSYKPLNKTNEITLPKNEFGLTDNQNMFDIKQLICHLLGIKFHKENYQPATLVYLFFKPKAATEKEQNEINKLFVELENEIKNIFNSKPIKNFITKNNIKLKAVAQYSEVMNALTNENIISLYK